MNAHSENTINLVRVICDALEISSAYYLHKASGLELRRCYRLFQDCKYLDVEVLQILIQLLLKAGKSPEEIVELLQVG